MADVATRRYSDFSNKLALLPPCPRWSVSGLGGGPSLAPARSGRRRTVRRTTLDRQFIAKARLGRLQRWGHLYLVERSNQYASKLRGRWE